MEKIAFLLAEGFEETEVIAPLDILRRIGLDVRLISAAGTPTVTGTHCVILGADGALNDADSADYDAVVLPGGMPGSANLRDNPSVIAFVQAIYAKGGVAGAICAAPIVLQRAGLLKDCAFTCYPGCEAECSDGSYTGNPAERCGRIVTGKGPGAVFAFAKALAAALGKEAECAAVLQGMLVETSAN